MTGDALTLDEEPGSQAPAHLALFAAVLLCRPTEPPDPVAEATASRAQGEALRALATGRAPLERRKTEAYRLLYEAQRDHAAATRVKDPGPGRGPQWERALRALYALRHRQRAALALRYLVGFDEAGTATILGIRELETRRVVEAAVTAASRLLGRPADVRRALRKAGARLILPVRPAPKPVTEASEPVTEAQRRPRPVVRAFTTPPEKGIGSAGRLPSRRPRAVIRRRWLAAAACLILASMLVPVSAYVGEREARPAPAAAPAPVRAPVRAPNVLAARPAVLQAPAALTVVVRRGDSLWAIGARELGDPLRWAQIWARNRGRAMNGRERFRDPDLIKPGWVLQLPR